MSPPLYVQLAQLENKWILKKISRDEYIDLKWELLKSVFEAGEIVNPIYKDKRPKTIRDSLKIPFCYIPPSPFIYGEENDFGLVRAGIYMSKFPVRVRDFISFLEDSGYDYSEEELERMWEVSPEMDCPVSNVSWLDAKEYCRWLRRKTGEYYSLPSEEEWEYSARGIDGRFYPWGNGEAEPSMASYAVDGMCTSTVTVNAFGENKSPFGCMGMVGNVWEWCVDVFDEPEDPHVLRGGAWCHEVGYVNCVSRIFSDPPEKRLDYSGFRVTYVPGDMFQEYQEQLTGGSAGDEPAEAEEPEEHEEAPASNPKPVLKAIRKIPPA